MKDPCIFEVYLLIRPYWAFGVSSQNQRQTLKLVLASLLGPSEKVEFYHSFTIGEQSFKRFLGLLAFLDVVLYSCHGLLRVFLCFVRCS